MSDEDSQLLESDMEEDSPNGGPQHSSHDSANMCLPNGNAKPDNHHRVASLLARLESKLDKIESNTDKVASLEHRLARLEKGDKARERAAPSTKGPHGPQDSKKSHNRQQFDSAESGEGEADLSDEDEATAAAFFKPGTSAFPPDSANAAGEDDDDDDQWINNLDDEGDLDAGPSINAKLASLANKWFGKPHNYQKIKDLQGQYLVPRNCEDVRVSKVNPKVWHNLAKHQNKFMHIHDVKLASVQCSIVAGSAAILQLLEAFTEMSKPAPKSGLKPRMGVDGQVEKLFQIGLHALTLYGHANYDISLRCRDSMQALVKQNYAAALCGPDITVTKFLFGDDLRSPSRK